MTRRSRIIFGALFLVALFPAAIFAQTTATLQKTARSRALKGERLGGIERRQSGAKDTGLPPIAARRRRKTFRRAPRGGAAARWRGSAGRDRKSVV